MAGEELKRDWWACNKEGCRRGLGKPINHIGSGTDDLFSHLDASASLCLPRVSAQRPRTHR